MKPVWPLFLFLSVMFSIFAAQNIPSPNSGSLITEMWNDKEVKPEPISILMTGDIMLDRYVKTLRQQNPPPFPFSYMPDIIAKVEQGLGVSGIDIVAGNLEGPITDSSYVNNGVAMIFNFEPGVTELLKNAGFTTFTLANNHMFDMGKNGLQETHDHLAAAGLDSFGDPSTPSGDLSFMTYDFGDTSIGFLGLNDAVTHLDVPAAVDRIKELDSQVDILIVAVHWGFEYEPVARESVVSKAHQFVDAGADFIWGSHPHVVQNHETYNGAPIYYSLGNFVFDQYFSQEVKHGLVLGLLITPQEEAPSTLTVTEVPVELVNGAEPKPQ